MTARPSRRLIGPVLWMICLLVGGCHQAPASASRAERERPPRSTGLTADELGLIINESDPLSVQIGKYYRLRRSIPDNNVVRVHIEHASGSLSISEFTRIKGEVDKALPARVQALALAWAEPYRVECMSITSAFATGFDPVYCAQGCRPTPHSAYFDSDTHTPFTDFGMRPAMLLAARTFDQARALIDRGVASDGTMPSGTAYLLDTSDKARNARAPSFHLANLLAGGGLKVDILKADSLEHRDDILFYFTGVTIVRGLNTDRFLPGAIADHLTSYGGVLDGSGQMSSLRWLEAGATASYGTVVEPCAFPQKFPDVPLVMRRYLSGETAIEAYWKSVAMPSQGVFVGEPLASPYGLAHRAARDTLPSRSSRN